MTQWLKKNNPAFGRSRGEGNETHCSLLAGKPQTEAPGGLQSTGQRVGQDLVTAQQQDQDKVCEPSSLSPCGVSPGAGLSFVWFFVFKASQALHYVRLSLSLCPKSFPVYLLLLPQVLAKCYFLRDVFY